MQYILIVLTLTTLFLLFLSPYRPVQALRLVRKQQNHYKVSFVSTKTLISYNVPMQHFSFSLLNARWPTLELSACLKRTWGKLLYKINIAQGSIVLLPLLLSLAKYEVVKFLRNSFSGRKPKSFTKEKIPNS